MQPERDSEPLLLQSDASYDDHAGPGGPTSCDFEHSHASPTSTSGTGLYRPPATLSPSPSAIDRAGSASEAPQNVWPSIWAVPGATTITSSAEYTAVQGQLQGTDLPGAANTTPSGAGCMAQEAEAALGQGGAGSAQAVAASVCVAESSCSRPAQPAGSRVQLRRTADGGVVVFIPPGQGSTFNVILGTVIAMMGFGIACLGTFIIPSTFGVLWFWAVATIMGIICFYIVASARTWALLVVGPARWQFMQRVSLRRDLRDAADFLERTDGKRAVRVLREGSTATLMWAQMAYHDTSDGRMCAVELFDGRPQRFCFCGHDPHFRRERHEGLQWVVNEINTALRQIKGRVTDPRPPPPPEAPEVTMKAEGASA